MKAQRFISATSNPLKSIPTKVFLTMAFFMLAWFGHLDANNIIESTNVALGKPATQSTTAFGGDASRAVDGNTSGQWGDGSVTHTQDERYAWWEVDLGAVYKLDRIVIWNRMDCCWERLQHFVVHTSIIPFEKRANNVTFGDGFLKGPFSPWAEGKASYSIEVDDQTPQKNARYVRIILRQGSKNRPLSLAEVQVFADPNPVNAPDLIQNIALGKPARQSTTAFGGDASRAVDGNTSGQWGAGSVTHTEDERYAWWEVDLGAIYELDHIVIWNREDCCWERLQNFIIHTSKMPFKRRDNVTFGDGFVKGPFSPWAAGTNSFTFDITDDIQEKKARYVRIILSQVRQDRPLSLAEVQVFGKPIAFDDGGNIAFGKKATQSSTAYGAEAMLAVDGNTSGQFYSGSVTHTEAESSAWWELDLGDVYELDRIVIWNRLDCCWDRMQNFIIHTSKIPFEKRGANVTFGDGFLKGPYNPWEAGKNSFTIEVDDQTPEKEARYIRIQLRANMEKRALSIAEVQVFGKPASN